MTAESAIRFLAHEADWCREKDRAEMFCLLLPAMLRTLDLPVMNGYEAAEFRRELRMTVNGDFRFDRGSLAASCGEVQ